MVEHQIIAKILANNDFDIIKRHGITTDMFPEDYRAEIEYLSDHYARYGNIPDTLTFLDHFNDFEMIEVNESDEYLLDKFIENYIHRKQTRMAHKWGEKLGGQDSREAFTYVAGEVEKLRQVYLKKKQGTNIVQDIEARQRKFEELMKLEGLAGVSLGVDEMDEATKGMLPEDLVIILARTNEGKTWILMYFLVAAWRKGVPVLMYSGEMSKDIVGYRFDTLNANFSIDKLTGGHEEIFEQYKGYLTNLSNNDTPFIVVTPKDLGQRLDIPMLHFLIEAYKPGIVGIDQISLMDDYRKQKGDPLRIQFTHVAEDLYTTSERYQIPILSPAQANRNSTGKKKGEDDEPAERKCPEVEDIAEADGIGQNATRVISIAVNGNVMKMKVVKNRYGKKDIEVQLLWQVETGLLKPLMAPKKYVQQREEEKKEKKQVDSTKGAELF